MPHFLVDQFRFTRSEWLRSLEGVTDEDAAQQLGSLNCISWIVGHMAWHEQRYWLTLAQDRTPHPLLNELAASGGARTTPSYSEMRAIWVDVAAQADPYLDSLTAETIHAVLQQHGPIWVQSAGSGLQRMIYHYWYHLGEIQAIRQMLGHTDLPEFVGEIEVEAPFRIGD
jgi:hypothetical protein